MKSATSLEPCGIPTEWADPDDAPELTAEWFARAEIKDGDQIVRRGRPATAEAKQLVTIRFPPATLARLRAGGPDWQKFVVEAAEKELA